MKRSPDTPQSSAHNRFTIGSALKAQGKLDEAASVFREAIRISPNHAQAYSGPRARPEGPGEAGRGRRGLP